MTQRNEAVAAIRAAVPELNTFLLSRSAVTYWPSINYENDDESALEVYHRALDQLGSRDFTPFIAEPAKVPSAIDAVILALTVRDTISVDDYAFLVAPWFGVFSYPCDEDRSDETYAAALLAALQNKIIK